MRLLRVDGGEEGSIANPEAYLFTVASNLVKEIARFGGPIEKFVTPAVAADVAAKLG